MRRTPVRRANPGTVSSRASAAFEVGERLGIGPAPLRPLCGEDGAVHRLVGASSLRPIVMGEQLRHLLRAAPALRSSSARPARRVQLAPPPGSSRLP